MNYTVQKGDTLWDLSRKHGIPLQDLLRQMPEQIQRDPRKLQPGMSLNIPTVNEHQGMPVRQQQQQQPRQYGPEVPRMSTWSGAPGISPQAKAQHAMERGLVGGTMAGLEAMTGGAELRALGRGLGGMANRFDDAYGTGAAVDGLSSLGRRWDQRQAGRAEDMLQRRRIDDAMTGGAERGGAQFEPLMPGQARVRDIVDQGGGGNIPLQPDVGSMARNNPNMSLGSLHKFMSPGEMPPGSMVRQHPSRVPTTVRPNPDREMYQQGFERMPSGGWGKPVYDSSKVPKRAPTKEEEEVYALLLASRDMNPTAVQNAASRMGHGNIMNRFRP